MITKPRNSIPTYRLHRRTGRAVVTVRDDIGSRRDILLPGAFNSHESREEYERVLAHLRVHNGFYSDRRCMSSQITIAELIVNFMEERVIPYYVHSDTKKPTPEQGNFRLSLRPLQRLYGNLMVSEFSPQHLTVVRRTMIDGGWMTEAEREEWKKANRKIGLARNTVNERIARIKLMFRWGATTGIVPVSVASGLATVDGLRRGRSGARETATITPVAVGIVEQTLPYLPPVVRDIVNLLLLTGMRCGEVVAMRAIDIDMTGKVWLYCPVSHKNAWRGHDRVIAIGPRGQDIVRRYLKSKLDATLFSPAHQAAIIAENKRARRKTKVQPSQQCRKKAKPKKKPGTRFNKDAINRAIRAACEKGGIPRWHTHQLRHTAALEISRQHGLEAARAVLGHKTVMMSAHYAGLDQKTASDVMGKIG